MRSIPRHELQGILSRLYTGLEEHTAINRKNSLVAGGCIRDFLNDKPIKDIDIFTTIDVGMANNTGFKAVGIVFKDYISGEYDGPSNDVVGVLKCTFEGYNVEIISVKLPGVAYNALPWLKSHVVDNFDLDICKVWFDPDKDKVHKTGAYRKDIINMTITTRIPNTARTPLRPLTHNVEVSRLAHAERVRAKYPGFSVRVRHV